MTTSKEWVKNKLSYECLTMPDRIMFDKVLQDLERLEKLEKIFSDSHICEIQARFKEIKCSADKCDNCPLGFENGVCLKNTFEHKWKLQEENQELKEENQILKKALDIACERLDWDCPIEQNLIDDLDCENCNGTYKECWKKYFLNEVKDNEKD